jgi:23S rRNA (guanosine2251-2'-O)-methyltransferase
VFRLWTAQAAAELPEQEAGSVPTSIATREELERLCGSSDHQGVVAEVESFPYASPEALLDDEQALVVALDGIQDPQNLGAICRSAECAGVSGIVLPERRSVHVTPAVCKASAGAVEHLAVGRARNLADFLGQARRFGAWIYGATAAAPRLYTEPDYGGRTVLVLGAEGSGLRPRVRTACDELVSIPLRGRTGSLNVSAAAAILIYEVLRQRQA